MTAIALDSTEAIAERVREASARGTPMRVAGRGTWLDAGRPVSATETISTRDLAGIVAYVPDDLTLTARAGTTLGEIREATGAHNQWLALDPYGTDDGTLGATVATASYGPLSLSFGAPRDLVLGVEFVTGSASIARGGGRVVKNVAGFDLTRLMTGAWGTLGVLTEITVRLHAKPQADVSVAIDLSGDGESLEQVRKVLRRLPFTPYACEAVSDSLASALGVGRCTAVLVRLGGNAESVAAQRVALGELGTIREADPGVWGALRGAEPRGASVIRFSNRPSEIAETWSHARMVTHGCAGALLHANVGRGIVRAMIPPSEGVETVLRERLAAPSRATRVGERLPAALWPVIAASRTSDELARRVKQAYDPSNILNPGILGGAP